MSFANDDFDRRLYADAYLDVQGVSEIKGLLRGRVLRAVRDQIYKEINEGERDPRVLEVLVYHEIQKQFKGVVLTAVLLAIISYFVQKILERLFG